MNQLDEQKEATLIKALERGFSMRAAAKKAGVDRKTARKVFRQIDRIICPCGRELPHNGWCSFRVKHSPARQKLLRRLANISDETISEWEQFENKRRPLSSPHYVGNFEI